MKGGFTNWLKAKLDSFEDTPTPADWAAMEQMINSQPSLAAKPWYRTLGGVTGIITSTVIVIGSVFWFVNDNADSTQLDATPAIVNTPSSSSNNSSINPTSTQSLSNTNTLTSTNSTEEAATSNFEETHSNADFYDETSQVSSHSAGEVATTDHQTSAIDDGIGYRSGARTLGRDDVKADPSLTALNERETEPSHTGATASESDSGSETSLMGGASNATNGAPSDKGAESSVNEESSGTDLASEASSSGEEAMSATDNDEGSNAREVSDDKESPASAVIRNSSNQPSPWAVTAYGTFAATSSPSTANEGTVLNESTNPMGFGIEADYRMNGWVLSSGLTFLSESQTTTHYNYTEQEILSSVSWYEWDTTFTQVIDSTWEITGINSGRWVYDTTMTFTADSILRERGDSVLVRTETEDVKQLNGYRISVPLLFGKEWEFGKWSTSVQAGPILTFSSTQWYHGDVYQATYNSVGVDLAARIELGYSFTDHWQGLFRLGYRTNAMPYSDYRKAAWTRNSVPLSLGVRYRF